MPRGAHCAVYYYYSIVCTRHAPRVERECLLYKLDVGWKNVDAPAAPSHILRGGLSNRGRVGTLFGLVGCIDMLFIAIRRGL